MKNISFNQLSVSLYCDEDFIQKMSNLASEPIEFEKFLSTNDEYLYINMYYLNDDGMDQICQKKDKIFFYWGDDLLSIFKLNYLTLLEKGVLYTSELNFVTNQKNENIYVYIFLN